MTRPQVLLAALLSSSELSPPPPTSRKSPSTNSSITSNFTPCRYRPTATPSWSAPNAPIGIAKSSRSDLWLYRENGAGRERAYPVHAVGPRLFAALVARRPLDRLSVGTPFAWRQRPRRGRGHDDSKDESSKSVAQVYLIRPDGGEAFPITSGEEEVHAFAWSPDSKTIYFATRIPWDKKQRDAYRKAWKDTVQYRAGERGDVIYSLDLAEALEKHAASGMTETPESPEGGGHYRFRAAD